MTKSEFRYQFAREVNMTDVASSLVLAGMAIEGLHGPVDALLDTHYFMNQEGRTCHVDASTPVGRDFNRVFVGFLSREFPADAYEVELLEGEASPAAA